jgi:formylglycine-generating enzyme required for sulfatase activity
MAPLILGIVAGLSISLCEPKDAGANEKSKPSVDPITIQSNAGVALEFIYVPPGEYHSGRHVGKTKFFFRAITQEGGGIDEGPARKVKFDKGFYFGRHQVTAQQFATFLNDVEPDVADRSVVLNFLSNLRKDPKGKYAPKPGSDRFPANTVTWEGAGEFCAWFTRKTDRKCRLPSEDEWEAATRGPKGLLLHLRADGAIDPKTGLLIGIMPALSSQDVDSIAENVTPSGIHHVHNWVGDWTLDEYRTDRGNQFPNAILAEDHGGHVLKRCPHRLTQREGARADRSSGIHGFRILLEATETGSPARELK